ncbi:aldose 1-epimerase [Paenibacillus sp. WQ 127069]|uniref:Aldose 1-epimerase n=1 Tax=Paenibacillus baimaensis TaxID=2982185 RepID=A0ABT2UPZ8_9BACL|nr:aldose 1-epimerase [Paenibacillus sp. WQ 127069]MCU6796718.1 aldose 1-epimerase [Paenibacillus sp. WQ 127069]
MNNQAQAHEGMYQEEPAVWLRAANYEAAVLPGVGANLIAFRDTANQYRFLHEPEQNEMEAFKANPIIHGIPVLFPPNRYEDGDFHWNGSVYRFPVNEPKTGNHLHGFVHNIPWKVDGLGADEAQSWVTLSLTVTEGHSVYTYIPHAFTIQLRYSLSSNGLSQHVLIRNDGDTPMPRLLAFHTSINAPFASDSSASDYRFNMTIGERWELDQRMLPTGQFQALTADEENMKAGGLSPFFESMDNHYTAVPQNGRNRMELTDTRNKLTLVYDVGTSYKQWMIWNNGATEGFFCPEPQINLVNAPNIKQELDPELIGLFGLEPGEIWEETSRLYVKKFNI